MKITKGGSSSPKPGGSVPNQSLIARGLARQAAREKNLSHYIQIECGHDTDLETQKSYAFARPKGKQVYCETCDKWLKVRRPAKPKPLDNEPMF